MSSLENALRGALAKGNQSDPIFRRRIYEAAANSMHKSLEVRGAATPDAVRQQNMRLAETIQKIEAEIKAQKEVAPAPSAMPEAEAQEEPVSRVQHREELRPELRPETPSEPRMNYDDSSLDILPQHNDHKIVAEPRAEARSARAETPDIDDTKIRKPYARFFAGAVAVALLGMGLIFVITTGAYKSAEERDTSVPNPERVLDSESFEGRDPGTSVAPETLGARQADDGQWVNLFTPKDPTTISLVGGATATIGTDSIGEFAEISTAQNGAEVQITFPQSVLNTNRENPLQLSLRARTDEGTTTQMSVMCNFGDAGNCGRHRFNVGHAENEFLVQIDPPNATTAAGYISLITDVAGEGKSIKLIDVRVRTVEQ